MSARAAGELYVLGEIPQEWDQQQLAQQFTLTKITKSELVESREVALGLIFSGPLHEMRDTLQVLATQGKANVSAWICQDEPSAFTDIKNTVYLPCRYVLSSSETDGEVHKVLNALNREVLQLKENEASFAQFKAQNRELETLTGNLETLVRERTQHLEQSKMLLEQNLQKVRTLVRFVRELSTLESLESLVHLLFRELRKYQGIKPPILAVKDSGGLVRICHLQGNQYYEKMVKVEWPKTARITNGDLSLSSSLADVLGRPVGKVLAIPMSLQREAVANGRPCASLLFLEHYLNNQQIEELVAFLQARLGPLAIAVDRLQLQYELNKASFLWERTFDHIEDAISIVNIDGSVLRSNKRYRQDLQSFSLANTVDFGEQEAVQQPLSHNGRIFELNSYPIFLGNSREVTTVVNHFVDVTLYHEFQSQIIQNEKMAAIGQLAGHIAHELNNPLTGIKSLAQLLLAEWDPQSRNYEDLQEIFRAADRCQGIIHNLLDFSKGEKREAVSEVDLNQIVNRTLPLLKMAMRTLNCEVQLQENLPKALGEPHLIQQVVFNLVKNACQASDNGGQINIVTELHSSGFVQLSVQDTGQGIAEEQLDKIFEPFFTTKPKGQGTGLGLSMCKRVVESFQGRIEVSSQLGKGAKFIVILPKAEQRDENSDHR